MPRGHVLPDGDKIVMLRGEAGLTQSELATAAGYGLRTIGKIEDGQPTVAQTLAAIATVLSKRLRRPVPLADLIRHGSGSAVPPSHRRAAEPCVVEEGIKFLDLSAGRPESRSGPRALPANSAILLDVYRFRPLPPEVRTLSFHYATMGERMEARCLSHPLHHEWLNVTPAGEGHDAEPHLHACYQMRVHLPQTNSGRVEVQNRLEFLNAFAGPHHEWFHTHVIFPTENLTLVLAFPEDRLCRKVQGVSKRHPAEPFGPAADMPIWVPTGRIVYWRIKAPLIGATYQLEWEW